MNKEKAFFDEIAAYIVEPIITDFSKERIDEIKTLRARADQFGFLLIFDETITGYRFPSGSFANFTGIRPDISIIRKAVAGGLPLSVVGGKEAIMNSDYFVSSTWGGDRLAIASAIEAHKMLLGEYSSDALCDRDWETK